MILKSPETRALFFCKIVPPLSSPQFYYSHLQLTHTETEQRLSRITSIPIESPAHTLVFLTEMFSIAEWPSLEKVLPPQKSLSSENVASKAK